jgi:Cys-tRNA(Pro) deacylase
LQILVLELSGEPLVLWPPSDPPPSPAIPPALRAELTEAKACLRAGTYPATVVTVRRLLEGVCRDQGAYQATLYTSLHDLARQGLIEGRLLQWAEELRVLGNTGAHLPDRHTRPISREDAQDAVALAEALLDYLYVFSRTYAEFRKRRGGRDPIPADTPALRLLKKNGVAFAAHPVTVRKGQPKSRMAVADELGVTHARFLKAVICYVGPHVVVAVVPVNRRVDLKATGGQARIADAEDVHRLGWDVVSPLGLPLKVPVIVDEGALRHPTVFVASGRQGLELELTPEDLIEMTEATTARIAEEPQ